MTIASGLKQMPRVFLIENDAPNAFAVGRKPENAAVAVTSGLIKRLSRDELQGVIAHEIGHIRNLDIKFMTLASVMVGAIVLIADIYVRAVFFGAGRSRRRTSSNGGGGQGQAIMLVIGIVLAILAPIFANMLYFACSRRREYMADASAARFTRFPPGLASALEKIALRAKSFKIKNRTAAPMFIINPLQAVAAVGLFATHPPTEKRIAILREMGGAGFGAYEKAYQKVQGKKSSCLGGRTLAEADSVAAREALREPDAKKAAIERAHEVADLLGRMGNYLLIPCACGVGIKLPPEFKKDSITCTRCGRKHRVPKADRIKPGEVDPKDRSAATQQYRRRVEGWEAFRCDCGHTLQLAPSFKGEKIGCPECGAKIHIS